MPQFGFLANEVLHETDALHILKHIYDDTIATHIVFRSQKSPILADDDPRNLIQDDRATAHRAWRKSRVDCAVSINRSRKASCVAKAIHFAMIDRAACLDAAIMTSSYDFSIVDQHGSNGDASF